MKKNFSQLVKTTFVVFMTLCSVQLIGQTNAGRVANTGNEAAKSAVSTTTLTNSSANSVILNQQIAARQPYSGTPAPIPGVIEAENYDIGVANEVYKDNSVGNAFNTYRTDDVDIENCGEGGYNIGSIAKDEWLEYTVNVQTTGAYEITARVAGNQTKFHILFDGVDITGNINVPGAGGWQNWQNLTLPNVNLTAGQHIMRIYIDDGGFNLNKLTILLAREPYSGSPAPIPGVIEAENYDKGVALQVYKDTDAGNRFNTYRNDDVDIETCGEGGFDIGSIAKDEWLEYTVNVQTTGTYDIIARVAGNKTKFHILFDGVDKTGNISVPGAGGWQNWQDLTIPNVILTAGQHIMRIYIDDSGFNLNKLTFNLKSTTIPNTHTVKLEVINGWSAIRSFEYYNGNAWVSVDDNDPAISYTNFGLHVNSYHESNTPGATAQLTFIGTGIRLKGITADYNGTAKIFIDNVYQQDITFKANSIVYDALIYEKTGLTSGVTTDIENTNNYNVKIYTNSATNVLHIANTPKNSNISIFSIDGKLVSNLKSTGSEMQINVAGWNKGVYVLKIHSDKKDTSTKLIIN